ncbi:uncharacterized protein [Asterias amurensis]|uniref:uncharacterized protein n=1 Tax=Asterias amurensis TaxID=7602 RepID=UPI003AB715EA
MADQIKVILWACPRTVSSAFLKCMDKLPDSKMLFEMYSTARFFGPERQIVSNNNMEMPPEPEVITDKTPEELQKDPGSGFHSSICTYKWLKNHMETGYPDKKIIFAKEISFCPDGKFEYLPDSGYRHAFLIRNPAKVFPSWKKLVVEMMNLMSVQSDNKTNISLDEVEFDQQPPEILPPGGSFKETYDLYSYVKEKGLDPDPVILDADDLVNDPATILSGFCRKLGIPYSDELLSWDAGVDVVKDWTVSQTLNNIINDSDGFKNFRNGTCFMKPQVQSQESKPEVTADLQRLIDIALPYYKKMYGNRIQ